MEIIFETTDKNGRKIRLTKTQLVHILRHKGMEQHLEDIQHALRNPLKIVYRDDLADYYTYFRNRRSSYREV